MEKMPWDMIGAIIGGFSFLLTLIVEWDKLGVWRRTIIALIVGVTIYVLIIMIPVLFPTDPPEAPNITATPTKVASTSTPSNSVSSLLERISIPSNLHSGFNYKASNSGTYTFKYVDSAFTAYGGCWLTGMTVYMGHVPIWKDNESLDFSKALFATGKSDCSTTKEKAINRAQGDMASVKLNLEDVITFVANDSYHGDNLGSINFDVYFVSK